MRISLFFVLLALLLGSYSAQAQAPSRALPASPSLEARPPLAVAPVLASLDTAAVLHEYFARRRHNGRVSMGVGAGLVVGLGGWAVIGGSQTSGDGGLGYAALLVLGVVSGVPLFTRGAVITATHSEVKEQRILEAWQQHRLPQRWARRALVLKYTQP